MSKFKSYKQPIQLQNTSTGRYYRATASQLKPYLYGFKETVSWPIKGLPKTTLDGIVFWVNPLGQIIEYTRWGRPVRKGMNSRLMCECPICSKVISYGRLHQHLRVHHEDRL